MSAEIKWAIGIAVSVFLPLALANIGVMWKLFAKMDRMHNVITDIQIEYAKVGERLKAGKDDFKEIRETAVAAKGCAAHAHQRLDRCRTCTNGVKNEVPQSAGAAS